MAISLTRKSACICFITILPLSGCSDIFREVQGAPEKPVASLAKQVATSAPAGQPVWEGDPHCDGKTGDDAKNCFSNFAYSVMDSVDDSYIDFKEKLFYGGAGGAFVADMGILGTTLASSVTAGAATKATLSAIAAGITGTKTAVDADVLFNNSMLSLIAKMDADREQIKVSILNNLNVTDGKTKGYISRWQLRDDLVAYFEAGQLHNTIIGITNTAGATLNTCKAAENALAAGNAKTC
jgi:hypothetical protein